LASQRKKLPKAFTDRCEALALSLRAKIGIPADARLAASALARHLNIPVWCPTKFPGFPLADAKRLVHPRSGFSGTTVARKELRCILHNTGHPVDRQESNLFHEISHVLCKHPPQDIKDVFLRAEISEHEQEAEWMGSCLHLPRVALENCARNGMTYEDACRMFCASRPMLQWRLNMTRVRLFKQSTHHHNGKSV
jgi:IrrE N-terminal-like domain